MSDYDLNHHNAESDALACAKLMIELFKKHNTQSTPFAYCER